MRMGHGWTLPEKPWILPLLTCGLKGTSEPLTLSAQATLMQARGGGAQGNSWASVCALSQVSQIPTVGSQILAPRWNSRLGPPVHGRWMGGGLCLAPGAQPKSCQ